MRKASRKSKPSGFYEDTPDSRTRSLVLVASEDRRRLVPVQDHVAAPRLTNTDGANNTQPAAANADTITSAAGAETEEGFFDQDEIMGVDEGGEVVQFTAEDEMLGRARRYKNSVRGLVVRLKPLAYTFSPSGLPSAVLDSAAWQVFRGGLSPRRTRLSGFALPAMLGRCALGPSHLPLPRLLRSRASLPVMHPQDPRTKPVARS